MDTKTAGLDGKTLSHYVNKGLAMAEEKKWSRMKSKRIWVQTALFTY